MDFKSCGQSKVEKTESDSGTFKILSHIARRIFNKDSHVSVLNVEGELKAKLIISKTSVHKTACVLEFPECLSLNKREKCLIIS